MNNVNAATLARIFSVPIFIGLLFLSATVHAAVGDRAHRADPRIRAVSSERQFELRRDRGDRALDRDPTVHDRSAGQRRPALVSSVVVWLVRHSF